MIRILPELFKVGTALGAQERLAFVGGPLLHFGAGDFDKRGGAVFIRRVGPQGRADHRPTRRQRTPRPPDVQRGNMPMPDGLLAPRVRGDALDRQVNFDEAFGILGHWLKVSLKTILWTHGFGFWF